MKKQKDVDETNRKSQDEIRKRLKTYEKECLECLWGERYSWGNTEKTVLLMNNILKGIIWGENKEDFEGYQVSYKKWSMDIFWSDNIRNANLSNKEDDHTAWVEEFPENSGTFIDCDIGGS